MTSTVVLHVDDLGMSHSANAAFAELARMGRVTCGSVMVPCPWFAEVAALARADASLDIGVHLTLTSEMEGYRWRPLTRPPASAGLTDAEGFFHKDVPTLRARANRDAVEAELRAQVDAALAVGIDVTHLDDHMGAVLAPEFAEIYVKIAKDYRLPPVFCADLSSYGGPHNMVGVSADGFVRGAVLAGDAGFTLFERIIETLWTEEGTPEARLQTLFDRVQPGLNFLALHVAKLGDIDSIDQKTHRVRTGEYEVFRSDALADMLARSGFNLSGMRALRDAYRAT